MRIGDQHDNQKQCVQYRFVEERRLVPLPEFLYVNTIRKNWRSGFVIRFP